MLNHNLSFVQKGNNCGCSVHNSRDREMLHAFCCFALFFVFLAQVCACVRIRAHLCLFVVIWFIFGGAQSTRRTRTPISFGHKQSQTQPTPDWRQNWSLLDQCNMRGEDTGCLWGFYVWVMHYLMINPESMCTTLGASVRDKGLLLFTDSNLQTVKAWENWHTHTHTDIHC